MAAIGFFLWFAHSGSHVLEFGERECGKVHEGRNRAKIS